MGYLQIQRDQGLVILLDIQLWQSWGLLVLSET